MRRLIVNFKSLRIWLVVSALFSPGMAFAQSEADLERDCPIPYVVSNQQSVLQGYLRASSRVADAIPGTGGLAGARIDALRATVHGIIAGEAEQALADLRSAYLCRIRKVAPENKHDHAVALMNHTQMLMAAALIPDNWKSIQGTFQTYQQFQSLLAVPVPGLDQIPPENRITAAELRQAIGNPDFRSRTATRESLEIRAFGVGGGVCRGAVQATLALVDVATIGALAAHHIALEDLLSSETRGAGQGRILVDARSIVNSNGAAQVISAVNAAVDPADVQSCMNTVSKTANAAGADADEANDSNVEPDAESEEPASSST